MTPTKPNPERVMACCLPGGACFEAGLADAQHSEPVPNPERDVVERLGKRIEKAAHGYVTVTVGDLRALLALTASQEPRVWKPHLDYAGEPLFPGRFRDPPSDDDGFERKATASQEPLRRALEEIQLLATNHGAWVENGPVKLVSDIHEIATTALNGADK